MAKKGIHRSSGTEFKKGKGLTGRPFTKGRIPWNKGLRGVYQPATETIEKIRQSHIGKRYNNGIHWVAKVCQKCGKPFEVKRGEGRNRLYCSRECASSNRSRPCEGKVFYHDAGYRVIRLHGKPHFEHRLVAEKTLGRKLKRSEIVHHNNFNKTDNRPENLTVMSQRCHRALIDYLAKLWVKEHPDLVSKVTREYASGG